MPTPGITDPYWFEWYVGIDNIIKMLNPDNGIEHVVFQCDDYETIDDIVVGYKDNRQEICYQVKHDIATSKRNHLTFGKFFEVRKDEKKLTRSDDVKLGKGSFSWPPNHTCPFHKSQTWHQ